MRPAVSRLARSGRLAGGLSLAAVVVGFGVACGGGGGGGGAQPTTPPATAAAASPVASPQRPALASPVTAASPVIPSTSASPTTGGGGGNEQTYEIQPGDTLQAIADQFYGDASQWQRIYDANRDVIGNNPNALKVGSTLKIPPSPTPGPG